MNRKLHNKEFQIPNNIIKHLNETLKKMSHVKGEGMKRLRRLVEERVMTYQQLKRLKFDFKNINQEENSNSFNLNGGEVMYKWVNATLDNARKEIEQQKKSAQRAADLTPGKSNAYRKSHEKNGQVPSVDVSRLSESIKRYHKLIK